MITDIIESPPEEQKQAELCWKIGEAVMGILGISRQDKRWREYFNLFLGLNTLEQVVNVMEDKDEVLKAETVARVGEMIKQAPSTQTASVEVLEKMLEKELQIYALKSMILKNDNMEE